MSLPAPGTVIHLGAAASVQFAVRPIWFRLIRVMPNVTYNGWIWLDGYELNSGGEAVDRREVFVQIAGLRRVMDPLNRAGRTLNRGPGPLPSQGRASRSTPTRQTRS